MKEVDKRRRKKRNPRITSIPLCLVIITVAVHDVNSDNVTVLEDLVEIDSLILDLEGRDYVLPLMPMKH